MRTLEQIQAELNANGHVHLTSEESSEYSLETAAKEEKEDSTIFLQYSTTITQREQSVTKTASITFPRSFYSQSALLMLRAIVEDNSPPDFPK